MALNPARQNTCHTARTQLAYFLCMCANMHAKCVCVCVHTVCFQDSRTPSSVYVSASFWAFIIIGFILWVRWDYYHNSHAWIFQSICWVSSPPEFSLHEFLLILRVETEHDLFYKSERPSRYLYNRHVLIHHKHVDCSFGVFSAGHLTIKQEISVHLFVCMSFTYLRNCSSNLLYTWWAFF